MLPRLPRDGSVSVTPAVLPPLPPDYSLGASSLAQRDDVCEAVIRFLARSNRCVIGFENAVQKGLVHHDPTDVLLTRVRDLGDRVLPVSQLKGLRVVDGMVVDYVDLEGKVKMYWLWGMSVESEDRATFDGLVQWRASGGGISYRYWLARTAGKWVVVKEEPGAAF